MKSILIIVIFFFTLQSIGQSVGKKVVQKTNQKVDVKIDQTIDKGLNKAEETIDNLFKKKNKKKNSVDSVDLPEEKHGATSGKEISKEPNRGNQTKPGSFSDFVPGTTVFFEDRFEKDALADFPAQWNSNGSGKIVTIEGQPGKWLEIEHNTVVNPVMDKTLPENCTIEFDLFLQSSDDKSIPHIQFGLTPMRDLLKENLFYMNKFFVSIARYNERNGHTVEYGLKEVIGNKNDFDLLAYTNKVLHVSMTVNKTRVRVYLDKTKIVDLPRALTPELLNNFYFANIYVVPASELGMLLGNLRIASSETDARSLLIKQLMEEGKAVTNDILFDVNSDVIKSESFSVINQFGEALQNNPTLKIKIIGHTDSDGVAANNLTLSQKRAAAVKRYLLENYGIAQTRITTDGKGASVPVAPNTTPEGKSKNRRVEFTKL